MKDSRRSEKGGMRFDLRSQKEKDSRSRVEDLGFYKKTRQRLYTRVANTTAI